MIRPRLVLISLVAVACGNPPPPRATTVALPTASAAPRPIEPAKPSRPDNLALWAHAPRPSALLKILDDLQLSPANVFEQHWGRIERAVDPEKGVDLALLHTGAEEPGFAVRFHYTTGAALHALVDSSLRVEVKGKRVRVYDKASDTHDAKRQDPLFECTYEEPEHGASVLCANQSLLDTAGSWLVMTAPEPKSTFAEISPAHLFAAFQGGREYKDLGDEARAVLSDIPMVRLRIDPEGTKLRIALEATAVTRTSKFVRDTFSSTPPPRNPEPFQRTLASGLFSAQTPGGGPLSSLASLLGEGTEKELVEILQAPLAASFGFGPKKEVLGILAALRQTRDWKKYRPKLAQALTLTLTATSAAAPATLERFVLSKERSLRARGGGPKYPKGARVLSRPNRSAREADELTVILPLATGETLLVAGEGEEVVLSRVKHWLELELDPAPPTQRPFFSFRARGFQDAPSKFNLSDISAMKFGRAVHEHGSYEEAKPTLEQIERFLATLDDELVVHLELDDKSGKAELTFEGRPKAYSSLVGLSGLLFGLVVFEALSKIGPDVDTSE